MKHGGNDKYNVEHVGYNARMDTLQAAVLLAKLPYIEELNARRRHLAAFYERRLSDFLDSVALRRPGRRPRRRKPRLSSIYGPRSISGRRRELKDHLAANGVDIPSYHPYPLHLMKLFRASVAVASLDEGGEGGARGLELARRASHEGWGSPRRGKCGKKFFTIHEIGGQPQSTTLAKKPGPNRPYQTGRPKLAGDLFFCLVASSPPLRSDSTSAPSKPEGSLFGPPVVLNITHNNIIPSEGNTGREPFGDAVDFWTCSTECTRIERSKSFAPYGG